MAEGFPKDTRAHGKRSLPNFEEDPLIELARIVSEDGGFYGSGKPNQAPPARSEPSFEADAFSADLEAELMQELETTLKDAPAAAPQPYRPAHTASSEPRPSPAPQAPARQTSFPAAAAAPLMRAPALSPVTRESAPQPTVPPAAARDAVPPAPAFQQPRPAEAGQTPQRLTATWPVAAEGVRAHLRSDIDRAAPAAGFAAPADEDETPRMPPADADLDFEPEARHGHLRHDDPLAFAVEDEPEVYSADADEEFYAERREPPRRRGLFAAAAVLGVMLLGGAVAAVVSTTRDPAPSGPPPVIKAPDGAVKVPPQTQQAAEGAAPGQAVYDRVAGQGGADGEQLVMRSEEPREIPRVVMPGPEKNGDAALVKPVGEGADGEPATVEARLSDETAELRQGPSYDPIGPRKVKTLVVRPDGTIVSDAPAPPPAEAALPADAETQVAALEDSELLEPVPVRTMDVNLAAEAGEGAAPATAPETLPQAMTTPQVTGPAADAPTTAADLPTASGDASLQSAATTQQAEGAAPPATATSGTLTALAATAADAPTNEPLTAGSETAATDFAMPRPRPAAPTTLATGATAVQPAATSQAAATQPAATRTAERRAGSRAPVNLLAAAGPAQPRAATTATRATAAAPSSGYVVQISAQRSADQAQAEFNALKARYPSILGGHAADIRRADLGEKGTVYRVRVGPMNSRDEAIRLCEQLKAAGGGCFVTR